MRAAIFVIASCAIAPAQMQKDPSAWGGDHAGKPVPDFVHGDECLFCHRNTIGPGWRKNPHGLAMRDKQDAPDLMAYLQAEPAVRGFADDVTHTLGSRRQIRFLKQTGYGKQAILSVKLELPKDGKPRWTGLDDAHWQPGKFEAECVGCHATGVDSKTRSYSAIGHDCYTCHGVVDLEHSTDTSKIFLSRKRRSDTLAITSTCAQCHLRGGKARTTGLPYPDNFVPGDNLFKSYEADLSKAGDRALNPGDRHVWESVRDVVQNGSDTTCISCHSVHGNSTARHRRVLSGAICLECHNAGGPKKNVKPYTVHSALCEY
jgi:predicted CXXCH cytochrome family protein